MILSSAGIQAEIDEVDAVRTILADGKPLTILPRHAPLMAELGKEPIIASRSGLDATFSVQNGILVISKDEVKVLAESIAEAKQRDD